MERRTFIKVVAGGTIMTGAALSLRSLESFLSLKDSTLMPVLFLGHGSPMNAISDNGFTRTLNSIGKRIPKPETILCVSAHWMTEGSWVTAMDKPKTIHDFYGFPQALFDVQYPVPGAPQLAEGIKAMILNPEIHLDKNLWGLDHGTWSVLKHLYPDANIPVLQLSISIEHPAEYHFKLGQELSSLRSKRVLIVGSGNIVHNLRRIRWEENAAPFEWALEFDQWVKEKTLKREFPALQKDYLKSLAGQISVPTADHYYPFLYTLGAALPNDEMKFEFEGIQNGSISMRCVSFGMPA